MFVVREKKFNIKKNLLCVVTENRRAYEREKKGMSATINVSIHDKGGLLFFLSFFLHSFVISLFFLLNICHRCLHTCAWFFLSLILSPLFFVFYIHYIKTALFIIDKHRVFQSLHIHILSFFTNLLQVNCLSIFFSFKYSSQFRD